MSKLFLNNKLINLLGIKMELLSIIFISIAAILLIVLVVGSLSFLGLWLSEIGLWFFWIPLGMIIATIPFLVRMVDYVHPRVDFFLMLVSAILNIITLIRLLVPFLSIRKTNREFQKAMKEALGDDYLLYIDPSIRSRFFTNVRFKLSHYFRGVNEKRLEKTLTIEQNITYRIIDGKELKLDAIYPKGEALFPIIIFIHGGGWMQGSKNQETNKRLCKMLASYGYSVLTIDYRLSPPDLQTIIDGIAHDSVTIREMVSDIRSAIIFAKQNAEKYRGNPEEVFLFGRSAGAHLALLTALSCEQKYFDLEGIKCSIDDAKFTAVIAFYPITDLKELYKFYDETSPLRLSLLQSTGGKPERFNNLYEIFSPIKYINEETIDRIPPIFLTAGKYDRIVNVEQSEEIFEKFQDYGIPSVYLEFPWANHAFDLILVGPGGQLVYKYLTQFLVWSITRKKIMKIEKMASELGLHNMLSKEKIAIIKNEKSKNISVKDQLKNKSRNTKNFQKEN